MSLNRNNSGVEYEYEIFYASTVLTKVSVLEPAAVCKRMVVESQAVKGSLYYATVASSGLVSG